MAVPKSTPKRVGSSTTSAESSAACCAAASASRTLRSMRRASLAPATATGSKPLTSPATRTGMSLASNWVISAMPERPASSAAQASSIDRPTGETLPIPVIAMRCMPPAILSAAAAETRVSPGAAAASEPARRSFNYLWAHDGGGHRRACARPAGQSAARGRAFELRAARGRGLARVGTRVRGRARRRAGQFVRDGRRERGTACRARRAHRRDRPRRQARRRLRRAVRRRDRLLGPGRPGRPARHRDDGHGPGARRHRQGRAPPPERGGAQTGAAGARPLDRHRRARP